MMQRWTKRLTILFFVVAVLSSSLLGASVKVQAAEVQANLGLAVKSAILLEASTGKILYSNNPDLPLPPASMTKMMTEYLVLDAIKQKKINWEDMVPVSEYAFYIAKISDTSGVYLNAGESFSVKELYKAMAVVSANDATVLLAEKVAGSEANFVQLMNKKAAEMGMKNTKFLTSTGLPANELGPYSVQSEQVENLMSARDAAILARALIRDFPEALEYSKISRLTFRAGTPEELKMANNNWMLPDLNNYYQGVDGLKTGYTKGAGYCFTGTATRDNMRLISVVMGTSDKSKRFVETTKLFNYGFSTFKLTKKDPQGAPVKGYETAPVKKGVELSVPIELGADAMLLAKVGEENKLKPTVVLNDLTAPIKKGQVVGKLIYKADGATENDYLQPDDFQKGGIDLVASQDVEEASWIRLFFRSIIQFISNIFKGVVG